jgi:hypothetical protein
MKKIYSFSRGLVFMGFKYVDSTCIMHSLYIAKYSLSPVRLIYPCGGVCVLFLLLKATPFNLGSQRAGGGGG